MNLKKNTNSKKIFGQKNSLGTDFTETEIRPINVNFLLIVGHLHCKSICQQDP